MRERKQTNGECHHDCLWNILMCFPYLRANVFQIGYCAISEVETLFLTQIAAYNNGVIISLLLKEQHQEMLCDLWDISGPRFLTTKSRHYAQASITIFNFNTLKGTGPYWAISVCGIRFWHKYPALTLECSSVNSQCCDRNIYKICY